MISTGAAVLSVGVVLVAGGVAAAAEGKTAVRVSEHIRTTVAVWFAEPVGGGAARGVCSVALVVSDGAGLAARGGRSLLHLLVFQRHDVFHAGIWRRSADAALGANAERGGVG